MLSLAYFGLFADCAGNLCLHIGRADVNPCTSKDSTRDAHLVRGKDGEFYSSPRRSMLWTSAGMLLEA
jgi:hypothetical protein